MHKVSVLDQVHQLRTILLNHFYCFADVHAMRHRKPVTQLLCAELGRLVWRKVNAKQQFLLRL